MKNCVIFANCQGQDGIYNLLMKNPEFTNTYTIKSIYIHNVLLNKEKLDEESLKNADLFIYQPISDIHGIYSTNRVISSLLKPDCKKVSFPYVYNSGVFSTYGKMMTYITDKGERKKPKENLENFKQKSLLHGFGHIYQRIQSGIALEDLIREYRGGELDFNFEERWKICIARLRKKESTCDIKVADFLETNKTHMLFTSHNHLTTIGYVHMVRQLLKKIGMTMPYCDPYTMYWDCSDMLKNAGNPQTNAWLKHYDINMKNMGWMDQYSKKHWGKIWHYVDSDRHTESEIIDYYLNYKNICTLV